VINTIEDLINHFHADFYPDDLDRSLRSLDRRIYKDTGCGAWAKVSQPGTRATGSHKESWTCYFRKVDGIWERGMFSFNGDRVIDSKVPRAVLEYFWPPFDSIVPPVTDNGMQEFLTLEAKGRSSFELTDTVDVPVMVAHQGMFLVGSIVEGTDAEIDADPVYLPCSEDDLDAAVKYVEDEATSIWNETHGCEGCNDGSYGGTVDPDCKSCGGHGAVL
jgi:hypothetical protein